LIIGANYGLNVKIALNPFVIKTQKNYLKYKTMKKLNYLILLAFVGIIAFQACKTKHKIANIKTGQNKTLGNKDTIVNKQISDTNLYVFSKEAILKIQGQIPYGVSLIPGKPYSSGELHNTLQGYKQDNKNLDSYVALAKNNGEKKMQQEVIEENTQYYLEAFEKGYSVSSDRYVLTSTPPINLERIDNLPPLINQLFPNYTVFNIHKVPVFGKPYYQPSTIDKGKIIPLHYILNKAIQTNGSKLNLSLEEKIKLYITLVYGFDFKFTVNQIVEVPARDMDKYVTTWNYEFIVVTDKKEEKHGVWYIDGQILSLCIFENNEVRELSNQYTVY
jgi:hypothetical protein